MAWGERILSTTPQLLSLAPLGAALVLNATCHSSPVCSTSESLHALTAAEALGFSQEISKDGLCSAANSVLGGGSLDLQSLFEATEVAASLG